MAAKASMKATGANTEEVSRARGRGGGRGCCLLMVGGMFEMDRAN